MIIKKILKPCKLFIYYLKRKIRLLLSLNKNLYLYLYTFKVVFCSLEIYHSSSVFLGLILYLLIEYMALTLQNYFPSFGFLNNSLLAKSPFLFTRKNNHNNISCADLCISVSLLILVLHL